MYCSFCRLQSGIRMSEVDCNPVLKRQTWTSFSTSDSEWVEFSNVLKMVLWKEVLHRCWHCCCVWGRGPVFYQGWRLRRAEGCFLRHRWGERGVRAQSGRRCQQREPLLFSWRKSVSLQWFSKPDSGQTVLKRVLYRRQPRFAMNTWGTLLPSPGLFRNIRLCQFQVELNNEAGRFL